MELRKDTLDFISAFGYETISLRTFSDRKSNLKGIERKGDMIRCNVCGEFLPSKDIYLGIKNKPICKKCSPVKIEIDVNDLGKWNKLLWYKNEFCHHGVHISINSAHRDKDVTKVYAQFFEVDDKSLEEQWKLIEGLKLEPSIIVKTRKSYHVYFLIRDGKIKRFREIQERLAYTFGGDMQKRSESTCMRIPGFYHNKKEPVAVKLIKCSPNLTYTQDELVKGLSLLRVPGKPRHKYVDYSGCKDELLQMVYPYINSYIEEDLTKKIIMSCMNPFHKDNNPSAVFFKDSLYFYCSGCGYSKSLYEAAKENNWYDIINYIENKKIA